MTTTIDVDDVKAIGRRRRELEESLQDCRENLANQQNAIKNLVGALVDVQDDAPEHQLANLRRELKQIADQLEQAESALAEFNEANPTPKQLAEREAALELQREQDQQRPIREAFKQNVRRRLEILDELKSLEASARELFETAERRWRYSREGLPGCAGITAGVLNFLPPEFWSPLGGRHDEIRQIAGLWDSEFKPQGTQAPPLRAYELFTGMKGCL